MARLLDLDDLVRELAERQHGTFALSQLSWCSPRLATERVARGEWSRVVRGVYALPGHLDDWTAPAGWSLATPGAALAGAAAATWWGLDGAPSDAAYLLVPMACRSRSRWLRRTCDLASWEVRLDQPDGCLRVTDPTRTLIDVAAEADDLERMVESALRRGLTSVPRLRTRARQLQRPGRRGPAALLAVLERRPPGGMSGSDGEVLLLQLIRAAGLPEPERQYRIASTFFDLAWPGRRVLVELHGAEHRAYDRLRRDARKQNRAVLEGWTVLQSTWHDVEQAPATVLAQLRAALIGPP